MLRLATLSLLVLATSLTTAQDTGIVGAWRLDPELSSPLPPDRQADERSRGGDEGRRRGGFGGGFGGRGGGGMSGGGRGPSENDLRRMRVLRRRLTEPPDRLTIVRDGARVLVTDGDGRSTAYTTDGRKEPRVTGDGEFTSKATLEGDAVVVEEDFGGGVRLTTRYAPILEGDEAQLEVTLKPDGLKVPGDGRGRPNRDGAGNGTPMTREVTRRYRRT